MVLHFEKWSTWVHRWTVLHWLILLFKDFPRQFIYLTWLYTEFERQSRLSKKVYANIRNIFSTDELCKTFWFIFKFMMLILTHTYIYIINPFAKRAQLGKPVPMQPRQPATQAGWREPGPGCKGYIYIYTFKVFQISQGNSPNFTPWQKPRIIVQKRFFVIKPWILKNWNVKNHEHVTEKKLINKLLVGTMV